MLIFRLVNTILGSIFGLRYIHSPHFFLVFLYANNMEIYSIFFRLFNIFFCVYTLIVVSGFCCAFHCQCPGKMLSIRSFIMTSGLKFRTFSSWKYDYHNNEPHTYDWFFLWMFDSKNMHNQQQQQSTQIQTRTKSYLN